MREIKFRAKSKHNKNKWIYGTGIVPVKVNTYFTNEFEMVQEVNYDELDYYAPDYDTESIIIETIGQYTGLKDKNGKEIYEGDIILTQPFSNKPFSQKKKEKRLRGTVTYNIKCGKNFVGEPDKLKYWGAEWDVEIIDKEDYKKYCYWSWGSFFECEVIGNIYDNPELLEV